MSNFGFNSDLIISLLLVAGSFILALILELIGDFVFKAGRNKNATLLYRIAYNLKGPLVVFFVVSGLLWSLSLLDIVAGDLVLEGSDREWLNDSLLTTWGVLVIVILTISFSRITSVFLDWYSRKILKKTTTELDDKLVPPLKRILPIVIYLLGALQLLGYFGFSISPILAGLGIGGIAVALAVQPTLSNFFAGTYVLTEGALKEGDFIEIEGGIQGYVSSVGWRSTKIRDRFNNLVLIPNSKMAESVVTNFYSPETAINILITSGVAYEENLENVEVTVKDTLQQLLSVSENVANNTQPRFGFSEFGDSNINFWIFMQAKDWSASFQLKSEIIKAVHSSFDKKGITINYPTRRIIKD
jgi:small-conductance mechanosensitive channel